MSVCTCECMCVFGKNENDTGGIAVFCIFFPPLVLSVLFYFLSHRDGLWPICDVNLGAREGGEGCEKSLNCLC